MNRVIKLMYTLTAVLLGFSFGTVHAEGVTIAEVGSIDLGDLASKAASNNKQLMVVYYENDCLICDQLNNTQTASKAASQLSSDYAVYKTNIHSAFKITCPNGEQFADQEFMAIKGITKLPAVVLTDDFGNVTFVENAVTSEDRLIAVSHQYKKRNMAKLINHAHLMNTKPKYTNHNTR